MNARLFGLPPVWSSGDWSLSVERPLGILGAIVPIKSKNLSPPQIHRGASSCDSASTQLDQPEGEPQSLQAHYRALAGNQTYGICTCRPDGSFLRVNDALVKMLGFSTQEELLLVNVAEDLFNDPAKLAQLLGQLPEAADPVEADWARQMASR